MAKLVFDKEGERFYETGVSDCALFVMEAGAYGQGVAWNGITAITESPSGAEPSPLYADNIKYLNLISAEEFGATVEAYTYPDEFAACDGSAELYTGVVMGQQPRKTFALAYKTKVGNDVDGNAKGYKIHLIYGCKAAPSERAYATVNDSPEAITFSWELSTTPVSFGDAHKPTACITIDSTKVDASKMTALEELIYGTESKEPKMPMPEDLKTIFSAAG